jgi:glutamate carboxypeptidase
MNHDHLTASCERLLPAALDLLQRLVAVNSFTTNREGVQRTAHLTADAFAPLGFAAEFVPPANPAHGPHLVLRRPAVPSGAPTIALISHHDTVFPVDEERRNDFAWRREGNRIYGPGTNDIKGGTAGIFLLLHALRDTDEALFTGTDWVLLFNACEEVDSHDFGRVCHRVLPSDTHACLIFEADGSSPTSPDLVSARKGRASVRIDVSGYAAHAGGGHAFGANAIVELARVVGEASALTNYAADLTINVGRIEGGTVTNRVPHAAHARLELRAFDPAIYETAKTKLLALGGRGQIESQDGTRRACEITVTIEDETQPWPINRGTDSLIAIWKEAGEQIGHPVRAIPRGGLSDGNVLWESFPTLDGLGPSGENSHCSEQSADGTKEQEWVDADSFVPKTILNATAIATLRG